MNKAKHEKGLQKQNFIQLKVFKRKCKKIIKTIASNR